MRNLLLWDLDGVIVDSIDECLLTSYNTYLKYQRVTNRVVHILDDIPIAYREGFYRMRKYVRPSGEYFVIYKAISDAVEIDNYAKFRGLLSDYVNEVAEYESMFFSVRKKFRSAFPHYWLELHRIYPDVPKKWRVLNDSFDFYIVSNKDFESMQTILNYFDLPINNKNIFGSDFSISKKVIIEHILLATGASPDRIFFIDDNYQHLLDMGDMGIRLFFVSWGYGEIPEKRNNKIIHLELNVFDSQLIGNL